jgi:hypothetical protein
MKYRKKPVEIEAIQWDGTEQHALEIASIKDFKGMIDHSLGKFYIDTLEGMMQASPNDFIIKGVQGEYYPCKPDIFELTYEKVTE